MHRLWSLPLMLWGCSWVCPPQLATVDVSVLLVDGWILWSLGWYQQWKLGERCLNLMKNKLNSVAIVLAAPLTGMLISSPFFPRPVSLSQLLYSAVGFNFSFSCLHLSSLLCGHKGPVFLLTIILISWGISGLLLRKDLTFFVFEIVCRLAHNW